MNTYHSPRNVNIYRARTRKLLVASFFRQHIICTCCPIKHATDIASDKVRNKTMILLWTIWFEKSHNEIYYHGPNAFPEYTPHVESIVMTQSAITHEQYSIHLLTTHLLSIERVDWLKLHDMFNARDAKNWPRKFPVGFPVSVCALNLLLINIFSRYCCSYRKQMGD